MAAFRLSHRVALKPAPSPKLRPNPKILAPHDHNFSLIALMTNSREPVVATHGLAQQKQNAHHDDNHNDAEEHR